MIAHNTVLYISDDANDSNLLSALKETGCEVVKATSPAQAVAMLYVMNAVMAVVLDERSSEHASFDLAKSLRRIRPNVPVMLGCSDEIDGSPSSVEPGCVSTDKLTSELQHLLTEEATL
jgi:DNA-binding NtrC family response regulator